MSGADVTKRLNTNHGNLSKILASDDSIWSNKGYDVTNIFAIDDCSKQKPLNTQSTFGAEDRFRFRKRGGRIFQAWLKVQISAGTVAAANRAAYMDDLGDGMIEEARVEYSSKVLHAFNGEAVKLVNRLWLHDIARETEFAAKFAGMPPGAGGGEAQREANVSSVIIVYIPLDWLWFTTSTDYAFTPEALASEAELIVAYRALENLVYARVIATGATVAADPFTTRPAITLSELFTEVVHTPAIEKNLHLATFESRQGNLYKILDFEQVRLQSIAAAAGTYTINLSNFRLDSAFLVFMVRSSAINTNWAIDRMQSDNTPSILPGGGSVAALQAITSFRVLANGSTLVDVCTDVENRVIWRKMYFPGSQIAEAIYFVPWGHMLREKKNVVSFQNMGKSFLSNLCHTNQFFFSFPSFSYMPLSTQ
jgi:hypothetical protein